MDGGKVTIDLVMKDQQFQRAGDATVRAVQNIQANLERMAGTARLALLSLGGGLAFAVKEAADAERAQQRVAAALAANGEDVERWTANLAAAATEVQKNTAFAGGYATKLYAVALGMGVAADQTEKMVSSAMALSAAVGGQVGVESALRALVNADQEAMMQLRRLIPELKGATDRSDELNVINRALARGFAVMRAETNTFWGSLRQLWNELSSVAEEIGRALLPSLQRMVVVVRGLASTVIEIVGANQGMALAFAAVATGSLALMAVLPQLAAGFTLLKAAVLGIPAAINPITVALAALAAGVVGAAIVHANASAMLIQHNKALRDSADARQAAADAQRDLNAATTDAEKGTAVRAKLAAIDSQLRGLEGEKRAMEEATPNMFLADWTQLDEQAKAAIEDIERREFALKSERAELIELNKAYAAAEREGRDSSAGKLAAAAAEDIAKARLEVELAGKSAAQREYLSAIAKGYSNEQAIQLSNAAADLDLAKKTADEEERRADAARDLARTVTDRITAIAAEEAKLRGKSEAAIELDALRRQGAGPGQIIQVAGALARKTLAELQGKQRDLLDELKQQAKTEEQITMEKRAQVELAAEQGLITAKDRAVLLEKLRAEEGARRTANFGNDPMAEIARMSRASLAGSIGLPAVSDAQMQTAKAATELARLQADTKKVIETIQREIAAAITRLPFVGAVGANRGF